MSNDFRTCCGVSNAFLSLLLKDLEKQKSFLDQVTAKMDMVMSTHRTRIQAAGYIPADGFPEEEQLRNAFCSFIAFDFLILSVVISRGVFRDWGWEGVAR